MSSISHSIILDASEKYGTPFFIYDAESIHQHYHALRECMPAEVDIFYSIKANPAISIISEITRLGAGVELCSYFEIGAALLAGVLPEKIIYVGPAKTQREIEKCLEIGVFAIICESVSEFKLISDCAASRNMCARVALRINPDHSSKTAMLKMGGDAVQFGIDEAILFKSPQIFLGSNHVKIIGIHVYHGTRILDAETICDNTAYILHLAERIQTFFGIEFSFVDIGGGIGVPYFSGESDINLIELKRGMDPLIRAYLTQYPNTRIGLEVGRFLVADAGYLVCKIIDIKVSKGVSIIVADGGMHCFMAATGMGSLIKRNFPMTLIPSDLSNPSENQHYHITGPLCTPGDLIGKSIQLAKAEIGDLIMIHKAGAYGPTASPIMFLSQGFPAEILLKNGKVHLIRLRFSEETFFLNQQLHVEDNA